MKVKNWRNERSSWRLSRKKTLVWGVASFCLLVVAFFFDASSWNCRLGDESLKRASARFSTVPSENAGVLKDLNFIRTRSELNCRLADSALKYWNAYAESNTNVARTISVGLARWSADQATLERVGKEIGASSKLFNASGADHNRASVLEADSYASRETIDVFENWDGDGDSSDLDDALEFLRELDDEGELDDPILWTFNTEQGNPIDYAGFVSNRDFEPTFVIQTAQRASDASARLFFLLTLGGLFFSRRESILISASGVESAKLEIDAFMTLWNLARRLIFRALREAYFVFLQTFGLFFTGVLRRRLWTFSFLPSTEPLCMFATVRLNN